jgi:hypothetical protein
MINEVEEKEIEKAPSAPYTVELRNGRHVLLKDLPDSVLRRFAHKHLKALRKQVTRVCAMKAELDRREYQDTLANLHPFRDYNIFQMMTHATMLGLNNFNSAHPELAIRDERRGEEE